MILSCRVSTVDDWLELNEGCYRLHPDSFADSTTSWRRSEVENPFVEGKWTVNALRDNVEENLTIWVKSDGITSTAQAVEDLKTVFSQLNYLIQVTFDNDMYTYHCQVADCTVKASHELRHNGMAQVTFAVPRHPASTLEVV
jgi:hypothetical protein